MRIVAVVAVTADGFIARTKGQTSLDWTSPEDKKHFVQITKELGTMVLGSATYETIGRGLPGRRMIVMTTHPERVEAEGVETFTGTAHELVRMLEDEGVDSLAVIGGSRVYGQFLSAGLVTELELTVEPVLFGEGISLADSMLDTKLQLGEVKQIGPGTVVLRYQVEGQA